MTSVAQLAQYINRHGTWDLCYANTMVKLPITVVDAAAVQDRVKLKVQYDAERDPVWVSKDAINIRWPKRRNGSGFIQVQVAQV